jgi:PAS domain S-box-containing protein
VPELSSLKLPQRPPEGVDERGIAGFAEQSIIPLMAVDRELRYVFANEAYCKALGKTKDELIGSYVFDVYDGGDGLEEEFRKHCALTFQGEITRSKVLTKIITDENGRTRPLYWQTTQEPFFVGDGEIRYVVQRCEDVTHLVELQRSHDVISTELDHRVKNLMAVILATARITSSSATSLEQYTEDFCNRVDSMSRVYSRMSSNGWTGLQLRDLFEDEIGNIASRRAIEFTLNGPDLLLTHKASRDAGMIIHEYVANAVKYGCFSRPGGRLDVEWTISGDQLRIVWLESGVDGVKPSEKSGFGTRLIEMMPNASVQCDYRETGLRIDFIVPVDAVASKEGQDPVWRVV